MIDHVSIGVRDLTASRQFYQAVLAPLGYKVLAPRERTVGFGKRYPEFWINHRPDRDQDSDSNGAHVCLRAKDPAAVRAFHEAAMAAGAEDHGAPGTRPEYSEQYYATFIRDPDGNLIEAVTFVRPS